MSVLQRIRRSLRGFWHMVIWAFREETKALPPAEEIPESDLPLDEWLDRVEEVAAEKYSENRPEVQKPSEPESKEALVKVGNVASGANVSVNVATGGGVINDPDPEPPAVSLRIKRRRLRDAHHVQVESYVELVNLKPQKKTHPHVKGAIQHFWEALQSYTYAWRKAKEAGLKPQSKTGVHGLRIQDLRVAEHNLENVAYVGKEVVKPQTLKDLVVLYESLCDVLRDPRIK